MTAAAPGALAAAEWKRYYGFSRTPFSKNIAPSQVFAYPSHLEAAARIRYTIDEHTIGLVTGDAGAGKTVAARAALAALDQSKHTIVYLPNPTVGARGLHQQVTLALGVAPRFHRGALIAQTTDLLARERNERDKHTVLVIDEGHLLDPDQLEQLRLITNSAMDTDSLLAVVLLGQPGLRRTIRRGPYTALDQRIATRYHIQPLDAAQTAGYIRHHLTIAGRSDPLFADDAVNALAHAARGLPRQIGNLAVAALIAGYTRRNTIIDHDCATAAITDVTAD